MALFDQIKELLGLGSGGSSAGTSEQGPGSRDDVAVTVEHEPDTESEDAVKGTGPEPTSETAGDTSTVDATTDSETATEAATGTDTEAATGTDTEADADEADGVELDESEAPETASSAEPAAETAETEASTDETTAAPASQPASASTEDVQSINGIGPAYAERLAEADVETVGELATADADAVAETTGIALSRVEGWIEQASE